MFGVDLISKQNTRSLQPYSRAEENARSLNGCRDDEIN
jgi:hypothetical protein